MFAAVTGVSLSAAAGLNAYIPILLVGLLARFTSVVDLPQGYSWVSNGWVLAVLMLLLAVETVVDKIAIIDHVNDLVQTVIRPAAGGAVFAATSAANQVDSRVEGSSLLHDHPWIGWVLGIGAALIVHLAKSGARPVVNAGTVGTATPFVSLLEDAASLGLSLLAIFVPVLALIALVIMAWVVWRVARRIRRRRQRKARPVSV